MYALSSVAVLIAQCIVYKWTYTFILKSSKIILHGSSNCTEEWTVICYQLIAEPAIEQTDMGVSQCAEFNMPLNT